MKIASIIKNENPGQAAPAPAPSLMEQMASQNGRVTMPVQDGAQYRVVCDSSLKPPRRYGIECREKGERGWGLIYEADFSARYARKMADWLNQNGYVDFETLRDKLAAMGIAENSDV